MAGEVYGVRALVMPGSDLPAGAWVMAVLGPLWVPALFVPATALLVRYPTGQIAGRWQRRFDRSSSAGAILVVTGYTGSDVVVTDSVTGHANPVQFPDPLSAVLVAAGVVLILLGLAGIVAAAAVRMVRGPRAERAALAWLFVTTTLAVALIFTAPTATVGNLAFVGVPVAIAVGVLRYRLLGIELVVRRTLLYGTLTALVLGVFIAVSAGLAAVLPSGPTPEVVAAALIAVGLAPARDRVQRVVDRVFYGDRGNPLGAFARLGIPLTGPVGADPLPTVLAGVGEALRVPSVALIDAGGAVIGSWGAPPEPEAARVPLRFAGADLGALVVATRAGQRRLGRADRDLVETVAPLVAAVVLAGRLAADVRAEQARVLGAAQVERARLRSDLHDGLGPSLTGVGLGLEALQIRVPDDPRTRELLSRLRTEVTGALEEVRRIIEDLRPAVFDTTDLLGALRARTMSGPTLEVSVDAPPGLPPLRPEVETAAFRITEEALTNVVRHAGAASCCVEVGARAGALRIVVRDDGRGGADPREGGVGLASMRERAERLGGTFAVQAGAPGTQIVVELPLAAPGPVLQEVS